MDNKIFEIPIGWKLIKGKECFNIISSASLTTFQEDENGEILYLKVDDLNNPLNMNNINHSKIKLKLKENANGIVPIGAIILSKRGEAIRKNRVKITNFKSCLDPNLMALMIFDEFNNVFFKYLIEQMNLQRFLEDSAIPQLNNRDLYPRKFLIPENPKEQTGIASILTKVDEAIEATQNSIKGAEKLKKSLMQNLLSGKLKPDGTWRKEDEFYMDEKFGKVPNGWEVKKLKKIFKLKNGKGNPTENLKSDPINDFKIPVYGGNGITGYFNFPFLQKSTLIIGRVGEYCGSVYKTPQLSWVTDNALWISEIIIDNFDLDFWYLLLSFKKLNQYGDATGQPKITQSGIGNLKAIYPPSLVEQAAISARIVEIDNYITSKDFKTKTLQRLKKSLMQNLLTGKVRVDVEKILELCQEK